jgi:putative DNA primase/helicase
MCAVKATTPSVEPARLGLELFHTPTGIGHADTFTNGVRHTVETRGKEFVQHLITQSVRMTGKPPSRGELAAYVSALDAWAIREGPIHEVHRRVAISEGEVWVDLADSDGTALRIHQNGYHTVVNPPVRFVQTTSTLPLHEPEPGGSIDQLRPFLNFGHDSDLILLVGVLLKAFYPVGPTPVLVLRGPEGTGK